jgi:hypothetical protein
MRRAEAEPSLMERALETPEGTRLLAEVHADLVASLKSKQFTANKAVSLYVCAVDQAVWDFLGNAPLRIRIYRNYRSTDEGPSKARQLADAFVRSIRLRDHALRHADAELVAELSRTAVIPI